jgi:hypothetical protein
LPVASRGRGAAACWSALRALSRCPRNAPDMRRAGGVGALPRLPARRAAAGGSERGDAVSMTALIICGRGGRIRARVVLLLAAAAGHSRSPGRASRRPPCSAGTRLRGRAEGAFGALRAP